MKRLKLTTASAALLVLSCCVTGAVCKSRGHFSGVGFDFSTGGYHDVAVIVSPELNRAECPQILDDIKVSLVVLWISVMRPLFVSGHVSQWPFKRSV